MSGVRSVTELLEEGSSLGYCGEELRKWIDRERTLERELERERDKEERDKRVAERELKRLELEARIEASKAAAAASAATVGQAGQPVSNVVSPPKLPPFDETRDDIDTYISRFERVAEAAGWSRTVWPTALASLLAGRALELNHQLTDDVVRNFEAFKAALLKGYDITPEGCRRQFRNTRFREGESAEQLVCRFKKSFTKWVETDGCHQTFVGISDLVVREQFIKQCPQPLAIFLKERKIKCLEDCSEEADRWIDAHGHPCTTSKPNRQPREIRHISREKTELLPAREGATFHKDGWKSGAAACWRCGKVGHKQASCRAKGNQTTAATAGGIVYAAVCPTPVYDLVVGGVYNETFHTNEQGVQKVQHVSQETPGNESDTEYEERRGFSAAVTRGQARNGQTSIKTLKSSIADTSDPDIGASAVIEDTDEVGNPLLPTLTAPAVWSEVKLANTLSVGKKKQTLQRLSDAGLVVNPTKCEIGLREVDFLGHRIGNDSCQPQDEKIKKIVTALPPRNLTKDFVLRTDASGVGIGSVLMQYQDGELWPVSYASRKLSKAERNYSTVERELLAVVEGVKKYYQCLYGRKFTIQTDHMPLHYLRTAKTSNARIMRWALYMQQFEYTAEYIKGAENVGADFLSRTEYPPSEDEEKHMGLCCIDNDIISGYTDVIAEMYKVHINWHFV
ncbi:hypothetical protein Pmani_011295 [Petrolisthes manimaculis]|uniref:CCHC-type domain-containing protein n=1 Tax=Petrolisthes manimaculis TaxID=1843537 RepID=A0AAE1PZJ1_9EUCA|nr:hypothetical protein Pmani_011295 [Petrolisthes manimaculis]